MLDSLTCSDANPNFLNILDLSIAPPLLFYAYIPIIILSLLIGFFVFKSDNSSLRSKTLLGLIAIFVIFLINEIILWTAASVDLINFTWSLLLILRSSFLFALIYFSFVFTKERDTSAMFKFVKIIFLLPIILLMPTQFGVSLFNLAECEGVDGMLWNYLYLVEILSILLFLFLGIRYLLLYRLKKDTENKKGYLLNFGIVILLLFFSSTEFLGEATKAYEITFIGPIGMLIFLGVLAFLIVKYKAFNIKLIGAQALVVSLWFLVGSLLFVAKSDTTRIIAGITLLITTIAGYYLVKSVKKEVALREQIEELAGDLAKANVRLKELDKMKSEFVSIASHQLRSPLTSIRGYASMLVEGTYGKLPEKAVDVLKNISDSARFMAQSVEDYLNVSRIEAGNMKYELSDFNLKEQAEKIVDEMRQVVMKAGLVLLFRSENTGNMIVHADIGKTRQIINNIIDNAMKYTPHGTITVIAHDDIKQKKAIITIHDTGIGMDEDTRNGVFNKFVRAKNANSVNTSGTGLGLYVAKIMVEKMGGTVWAESEGQGKGSVFHIEFPLV